MRDKVGIFAPGSNGGVAGSNGGVAVASAVLYYRDELWPNCDVVWFAGSPSAADIVKHSNIQEVREYDVKKHFLYPACIPGCIPTDIKQCYFPLPWQNPKFAECSENYAEVPMRTFGIHGRPWHPMVGFSAEEDSNAADFISSMPFKNTVMIECTCHSGQSGWDMSMTNKVVAACVRKLGDCNFLFASPGTHVGVMAPFAADCSLFSIRQCVPLYNRCSLFVGVSSGISCVTCSWSANADVPRVEFVYLNRYSTSIISRRQWAGGHDQSTFFAAMDKVLLEVNK
jgi:hypothetical protein